MSDNNEGIIYSPEVLTEGGIFEVGSSGVNAVIKSGGKLLVIDPISLGVMDQLGTYPEAKIVKISPNSKYVCFLDASPHTCIRVIQFDTKTSFVVDLNPNFSVGHVFWSPDSRFIVYALELGIGIGIYEIEREKILLEGPAYDDYEVPLACFNPSVDYFSVLKFSTIVTYSTHTWKSHSKINCLLNSSGLIYTNSCSVAVWNSIGDFAVYSLVGEELFKRKPSITSRVKTANICKESRVLVLATFDDKVEIYDVFSWDKLYCFEYQLVFKNAEREYIWNEPKMALDFGSKNYVHQTFQYKPSLRLKPLKNICDEFKIKTKRKYRLSFSSSNEFLACFTPGFDKIVWIRSFKKEKLVNIIELDDSTVQGIKWHPDREILAILTLDSVIFWTIDKTFAIYCHSLLKSFHWVKAKLTICSIATQTGGVFIYIENG